MLETFARARYRIATVIIFFVAWHIAAFAGCNGKILNSEYLLCIKPGVTLLEGNNLLMSTAWLLETTEKLRKEELERRIQEYRSKILLKCF